MRYIDIVRNARTKDEAAMWDSVRSVSEMIERIETKHPEEAHRFLMREYGRLAGPHYCEELAREEVARMYHNSRAGVPIEGELIRIEDVVACMLDGDDGAEKWDAYVGANGMAHDLAGSSLDARQVLELAREFWLEDDDFDGNKIWWYYSNK